MGMGQGRKGHSPRAINGANGTCPPKEGLGGMELNPDLDPLRPVATDTTPIIHKETTIPSTYRYLTSQFVTSETGHQHSPTRETGENVNNVINHQGKAIWSCLQWTRKWRSEEI